MSDPFDYVLPEDGASACPKCEHAAIPQPQRQSWIRQALGLKPRPAECQERVNDEGGWGTVPCFCDHPSHGSGEGDRQRD